MKQTTHKRLHIIWFHLYEMPIRIGAFKLWCWQRLLRVPWAARRSNQSILKEINPEYLLEGLRLKLQDFGHLIWRANSLEKTLMLEKIEGKRKRGWQRIRWLDGITVSMDMSLSNLREIVKEGEKPGMLQFMGSQRVRHNWATEQREQQQQGPVKRWKWELTAIGHAVSFVIIKMV